MVVRSRKITITIVNTIFIDRKLLTSSIKVILPDNRQDVRVKKGIDWDYWLIKDRSLTPKKAS